MQQSRPANDRYFYAYNVTITNDGQDIVQLRHRHWAIMDGNGKVDEVRGPGVVGEQPILLPGKSFTYTSGCPLSTPRVGRSGGGKTHASASASASGHATPTPVAAAVAAQTIGARRASLLVAMHCS